MKSRGLLIFLLTVFGFVSKAQNYQFTNYSLLEGLPQSQVYCIHEDSNGFIWMGTRGGGVARFEGLEFQTYTVKDSLAGNYINAIQSLGSEIWVGTNSGLSYFDRGKWHSPKIFKGKVIQDIAFSDNTLWVVANGRVYQSINISLTEFEIVKDLPKRVKSLKMDKENVWLATNLSVYHLTDTLSRSILGKPIECFEVGSDGSVWVATHGEGFFNYQNESWVEYGHLLDIEKEIIYDLHREGNNLWISTLTKGIFKYTMQDSSFVNFKEENGLANNHCRTSLKDSWGNMWIGTGGGGVSKYSGQAFEKWSKNNGLKGNYIYSVIEDYNGSKWIGTSGGGVTIIDSTIRYLNSANGFSESKTKAIFQSKDSAMWLGTDGDGLTALLKGTLLKFNSRNGLNSDWIKAIAQDNENNLWIGTSGGGLSKFHRENDTTEFSITNFTRIGGDLFSDRITDLAVDRKGRLWYATQAKGLGCFDGYRFSSESIKGLNRNNLRSLAVDSHYLYVASTKGLNIVDLTLDSLYAQNLENPYTLTSENIYSIQKDGNGDLWVGTEKGLDHLVLDGKQVLELRHYDAANGFSGVETTTNASMLDKENNVWFGSVNGLFRFNTQGATVNLVPPKISWKEIKVGRKTRTELLEENPKLNSWVLPFGNNRISFDVIGVNHAAPNKVRYKWKLLGRDTQYSEPTANHFIEYGSLPPGQYTFVATAENENGIWSKEPIRFSFTVLTPFWMKTWFILSASIFIILILFLFYRVRISRLKLNLKQREEKLELEKNLVQLEQKALQLQMNPHFIFHTLNSIQELIATKEEKVARRYLTQFSKLMRQILDGSRTNTISLAGEIKMLTNYLSLEKFSHEDRFDFDIICENDELEFISVPSMILQPFAENALIHGALKAEKNGHVKIEFIILETEVKCIIKDNGPGLGTNKSDHNSSAIEITKERLSMLSGNKNSVEIKNQQSENKISGVEVTVLLPIIEENENL